MHVPRSNRSRLKLQAAAVLTAVQPVVMAVALGIIIDAVVHRSGQGLVLGIQAAGLAIFISVLRWLFAKSARCPLCGTPVMGGSGCVRHRMAKCLFGSYPLRVASHIGLRGQFTCPYCNEITAMLSSEQAKEFSANRRKRRREVLGPERDVWEDL